MPPPQSEEPLTRDQQINIEREEEKKLKAKYPQVHGPRGIGGRPPGVGPAPGPHSAFLQKRLAKGQKYFDSGDYQMAKQKSRLPGAGIPGTVVAPAAPAASAAAAATKQQAKKAKLSEEDEEAPDTPEQVTDLPYFLMGSLEFGYF